jgi:hypothetical protein
MSFSALQRTFGRAFNLARFKKYYTADIPVDLKSIAEFRNECFPKHPLSCWLDLPSAETEIDKRLQSGAINAVQADACRFWIENGYLIIPGLIDRETLDMTWAAYEKALDEGVFGPRTYVNAAQTLDDRKLDPHLSVPLIRQLQHHPKVLAWTDLLLGRKTAPFQTIMGHAGSEQAAHSDAIHMTTYPLGYLVANWIAFEDVKTESGPLEYYPGSHKLPYLLSAEAGLAPYEFKRNGYSVYSQHYEPAIDKACKDLGFEKHRFLARKGDVLFWHANLVHGGAGRIDKNMSRKALVCHFFAERTVTYHDLSGNPSRLHKNGLYAPMVI